MPTKPRSEVFRPGQQAVVHMMNRCVRKAFLMGVDKVTKVNKGHRKAWFENELVRVARGFAIDLMCYVIMSNHFHIIARSRPDIVAEWNDQEVILRWHELCPLFKDKLGIPRQPTSEELEALSKDSAKVAEYRSRLSDFSWLIKLICQRVAKICNAEDNEPGKFWDSRFKAKLLLDEPALIACMVYVDLNRIKALLSETLADSDHTSIQRRLQALIIRPALCGMLAEDIGITAADPKPITQVVFDEASTEILEAFNDDGINTAGGNTSRDSFDTTPRQSATIATLPAPDAHLAPLGIDELRDPIGTHRSQTDSRCSDKGCLPMTQLQYVQLLEWTADKIGGQHRNSSSPPASEPPSILKQLGLDPEVWCKLVTQFDKMFFIAAGMPETIDNHRSCTTNKRFHMPDKARELLTR